MGDNKNLDLSNSKLILDGTEEQQSAWSEKIDTRAKVLETDKLDRESVYKVRRDFYVGNQAKYTNIVGLQAKEKKGHANAVINYAGKTAAKIAYSLTNNPPNITYPVDPNYKPIAPNYTTEESRTQASEDFNDEVLRRNKFWKRGYRKGVFNQVVVGDFAIKIYPYKDPESGEWDIKVVAMEKMENLLVGWRTDDTREYDYVIADDLRSVQSVESEWGIKVPAEAITKVNAEQLSNGGHSQNQEWGTKNVGLGGRNVLPTGKNMIPAVRVREYDDENVYAIKIGDELVQLVFKDGKTYPKMSFWVLGENIPNPGSHWSISDLDYLIDVNIELNEASNEERDYIRVGANTKYVAYNMNEFDPESVKTGSGGVIFVDSPNGDSKFEVLQSNVNTYPADSFLNRMKKHIHDLGVPEVTYGASGISSGRSKAIDYQSLVDLTIFKRDTWEIVMEEISEKIQRLGYFYFKSDFFTDAETNKFKVRRPEFDWDDIIPTTQADKVVNVLNKVQMGLPFRLAFKELNYRDVEAVIDEMKKEASDPDLMLYRSKLWGLTKGVALAQNELGQTVPANPAGPTGAVTPDNSGDQQPTLTPNQNDGTPSNLPVSARGGTTSVSTPNGVLAQQNQNNLAAGK